MLAPPKPKLKLCTKCKTAPAVVILRHSPFCQPCFEFLFVGKYRSAINRSKAISNKMYTGKSLKGLFDSYTFYLPLTFQSAMLNLTAAFMHTKPHEKNKVHVFSGVSIYHIDESSLFGDSESTSSRIAEMMDTNYAQFPYHCSKLEDVFDPQYTESNAFAEVLEIVNNEVRPGHQDITARLEDLHRNSASPADKLRALFDNISKNSAKEDIYWHMKMNMLYRRAQMEKCDFIFLGESSTRQAIKMIAMTSKGRGYSAALDVGTENAITYKGLAVVRPMKDMLAKEIAVYNRNHNIDKFVIPTTNWSTKTAAKSSIERLTEEFIAGLDRDFPSTVSTVSRTASKLTVSKDLDVTNKCAICLICQVDARDYRNGQFELPPYVAEVIKTKERDERLRQQVQEFLLSDEED
ncbi:Cytoplasmic tRNA 2-thiolation protein 2 [Umbelopsis nana]